ncbi:MAG: gamma-glutamylcyclotransferase family protein [Opitutaceae bacterium]
MSTLLFVYGTLKRGCSNHHHLAGQTLVGMARTPPGFTLYDLGGYPGIMPKPDDTNGVIGEVWSVDHETLQRLDRFEGVHEGLYRREPFILLPPFDGQIVQAYISDLSVAGRREVGDCWVE